MRSSESGWRKNRSSVRRDGTASRAVARTVELLKAQAWDAEEREADGYAGQRDEQGVIGVDGEHVVQRRKPALRGEGDRPVDVGVDAGGEVQEHDGCGEGGEGSDEDFGEGAAGEFWVRRVPQGLEKEEEWKADEGDGEKWESDVLLVEEREDERRSCGEGAPAWRCGFGEGFLDEEDGEQDGERGVGVVVGRGIDAVGRRGR